MEFRKKIIFHKNIKAGILFLAFFCYNDRVTAKITKIYQI